MPTAPKKRKIATKQNIDSTKIEATTDHLDRALGLTSEMKKLHWGHNEIRRLGALAIEAVVDHLQEQRKEQRDGGSKVAKGAADASS